LFESYFEASAKYGLAVGIALVVSLVLVPLVIRLAPKLGMVDVPDARRVHKTPTPRGGGMAVFFGVHLSLGLLYFLDFHGTEMRLGPEWWLAFLAASSVLLVVGVLDDSRGLPPLVKLGGQILAALTLFALNGGGFAQLLGFDLPWIFHLILTVVWCVAIINAFNLIDGLDGLCSGLALIGATGIMLAFFIRRESIEAIVPLAVMGGCLGFLRYNFHPARVFLGDTGSMFLGFSLAAIALEAAGKSTLVVSVGVPLLFAGIPLFDTILAVWRRSMRKLNAKADGEVGGSVMGADKDHLHHRLLARGFGQRKTVLILYGAAVSLVLVSLLALTLQTRAIGVYLLAFTGAVYVIVRHVAHIELWDTGVAIARGLSRPGRAFLTVVLYLLWDLSVMAVALALAFLLAPDPLFEHTVGTREEFFLTVPIWIAPVFLSLLIAQTYRRVWGKAGMFDFIVLQTSLAVGFLIVLAFVVLDADTIRRLEFVRMAIFGGITFVGVIAGRSIGQIVLVLLHRLREKRLLGASHLYGARSLVYGTGEKCLLFLKERTLGEPDKQNVLQVAGLLDSQADARSRLVKGYPVLGSLLALPRIMEEHPIEVVVLTEEPTPEEWKILRQMQQEKSLEVRRWVCELRPIEGAASLPV